VTFWEFLHRLGPGWPTERQWVTIWIVLLSLLMMVGGYMRPALWEIDIYKTILQAVVITGLLNMVLAFHFSANQGQHQSSENTRDALRLAREAQAREAERPTGAADDPVHVEETPEPRR